MVILFMSFGLLAPEVYGHLVYVLCFTCPRSLWSSCLCPLVYLPPKSMVILFMSFGLLAPEVYGHLVYVLWFTCSRSLWSSCLCHLVYLLPKSSKCFVFPIGLKIKYFFRILPFFYLSFSNFELLKNSNLPGKSANDIIMTS
jgi:hypothetical protein